MAATRSNHGAAWIALAAFSLAVLAETPVLAETQSARDPSVNGQARRAITDLPLLDGSARSADVSHDMRSIPAPIAAISLAPQEDQTVYDSVGDQLSMVPEQLASPERLNSTLQLVLTMSIVTLAPAILLMTTSFVRIAVVLGLLRQALGIQQLPSNQVLTSIALFMSLLIMTPVWTQVYHGAIQPYTDPDVEMSLEEAWQIGVQPIRSFMSRQIKAAENGEDIWLFYQYLPPSESTPQNYDEVPLQVLLPAFMLSELKTAFLIGFQIYLPFVILDLVVASITASMGMVMLPPMMVSLPLKLMLFVLVDGWNLVVGMLLESFAMVT